MVENLTEIKNGITINVGVSAKTRKNTMCAKNVISGILLQIVVKMVNI